MCEISVIIPVYNVEHYLEGMLDSVVRQTVFDKIEVLLIDDGSQDRSYTICREYSAKYHNIRCFTQSNSGVSVARNKGLEQAIGDYILFLDSDDTVEPDMCEDLLAYMQMSQADMVSTDYSFIIGERTIKKRKVLETNLNGQQAILQSFFSGDLIDNSLCDKLFLKERIGSLRLREGYAIGEDMFFVFEYLLRCQHVYINTFKSHYNYIQRQGSAMHSPFSDKYFDAVYLSEKMEDMVDSALSPYAEAHTIHEKSKAIRYMLLNGANLKKESRYQEYIQSLASYSLLDAYKYLKTKQFLAIFLLKIHPILYKGVYCLLFSK